MSELFTQTAQYQLIEGDCLKLLPAMPPETVDVVWTDPPYWFWAQLIWIQPPVKQRMSA